MTTALSIQRLERAVHHFKRIRNCYAMNKGLRLVMIIETVTHREKQDEKKLVHDI